MKQRCARCKKDFEDKNLNEFEVGEYSKRIWCNSCVKELWELMEK